MNTLPGRLTCLLGLRTTRPDYSMRVQEVVDGNVPDAIRLPQVRGVEHARELRLLGAARSVNETFPMRAHFLERVP